MKPKSQNPAFIRFSPRILEHLGVAAYNSVQKCVAEIVANGYDADATKIEVTLPDTLEEDAYIEITDNGEGMSAEDIEDKFLYIGRNKRESGQKTKKGRLIIGSKGIGKLAGFGIASRIEVITRRGKTQSSVEIDREQFNDIKTLSECELQIKTTPTKRLSGTTIRLFDLNQDLTLPSAEVIRRHLFRFLPQTGNFEIKVNQVPCSAESVLGERVAISQKIPGIGNVTGFYIIANARQPNPGLSIRVRGRIVKEASLFGLDTKSHGFFTAEKVVGELNAEFFDPESPGARIGGLINTTRDGFLEDSPVVQTFNEWARGFLRQIVQGVDEGETTRRTNALLANPAIKDRLDKMPAHVRGTATKVVRSITQKLKNVEEEDAQELIDWILRYYESNILRELMKAILSAENKDAEKLAELVQDWGVKQVGSVVDIIRTQIQIIEKLESLTSSNASLEIDLHKLIEANLWLIKEGLELWSSDKPLIKVLGGHIDKLYKSRKDIRPDLLTLSRSNGNEAVILEFKKPSEKIVSAHVTQAMEYEGIIKKHRPNIGFTTYVIGRRYDPSVLAMKEKLEGASLYFWSFDEVLQRARVRFETILTILGR